MTWRASLTSAVDAMRQQLSDLAALPVIRTVALSGPVEITAQQPPNGISAPTTPDLTARAIRYCNRSPQAVATYLARHQTLSRGR